MKFSIVMPTLNRGERILPSVQSVLSQDYPDFELIIKDGGDPVASILPRDKRIHYIHCSDTGLGNALNQGYRAATGDVVVEANDDDFMAPGALRYVSEHLGTAMWGYGLQTESTGRVWGCPWDWDHHLRENIVPQPCAYWRRELFDLLGPWEEEYDLAADYDWWFRLGQLFEPVFWDVVLATYNWWEGQLSVTALAKQQEHAGIVRRRYA